MPGNNAATPALLFGSVKTQQRKREGGGEEDVEEEEEESFLELSLEDINDVPARLLFFEATLGSFSSDIILRKSLTGLHAEDSYLGVLMGPGLKAHEELAAILCVQWLHVRCLAISSKEMSWSLIAELALPFRNGGQEEAERLLTFLVPALDSLLSPKLQARIAGFLADAFFLFSGRAKTVVDAMSLSCAFQKS